MADNNCIEEKDFFEDWRTCPRKQPKYYFSEALTYYKQLCKMQKAIEDLKVTVGISKINGSDTIEVTMNTAGTEATLEVKPEGIDIEDLENYDVLEGRVSTAEEDIDDIEEHITDIDNSIDVIEGDINTLNTGKQNKLGINPATTTQTLTGLTIDNVPYAIQGGGVSSYDDLTDKPQINSVELSGNKSLSDLGITKSGIGLGNVDNTSDANKPISTATQNALDEKADITDIPTNSDFTLAGLGEKSYNSLTNRPTIPASPVTRTNITVSGTPSALSSYCSWDTQEKYGYYLDVTISGLTANSMVENIIMTDTIQEACAYVITTSTNALRMYFEDNTTVSGTIYTLITSEVA